MVFKNESYWELPLFSAYNNHLIYVFKMSLTIGLCLHMVAPKRWVNTGTTVGKGDQNDVSGMSGETVTQAKSQVS